MKKFEFLIICLLICFGGISASAAGNTVFFNYEFENIKTGNLPVKWGVFLKNDNNIARVEEFPSSENKSFYFAKKGENDPYVNIYEATDFNADNAVLEFSFYSPDTSVSKTIMLRDINAQFNALLNIGENGIFAVPGQKTWTYNAKVWNKVVCKINFNQKKVSVYLNDNCVANNVAFANPSFGQLGIVRVTYPAEGNYGELYIDNLRFYEGTEQLDIGSESTSQYIASESAIKKTLEGHVAMTALSSKAYVNNNKISISPLPEYTDGQLYIPVKLTAEGLGGSVSQNNSILVTLNGNTITLTENQSKVLINNEERNIEFPVKRINETIMMSISDFSSITGIAHSFNRQYRFAVIGTDADKLSPDSIQDIYNYVIYTRPSKEQILKDFGPMNGVHPRIMVTEDVLNRIKQDTAENLLIKSWYKQLLQDADKILTQAHTYYAKPDGLRLLEMSRQLLDRAQTLGMAYKLSGETKYAEYLWGELDAVCNFNDWNSTNHFLDTAEMITGVAIAYDWLYDYWTPLQRKIIENAILNLGLLESEKAYDGDKTVYGEWVQWDSNWNQVCNGGTTVGCLAIMDIYPELCSKMIETAFYSQEKMMCEFAPDGAWREGVTYWYYTIQYVVYQMASLDTALGTDYGYYFTNGINDSVYFLEHIQSAQSSFNFHDTNEGVVNAPQVFYFADKNNDGKLAKRRIDWMKFQKQKSSALDLIFLDTNNIDEDAEITEKDKRFESIETTVFRSEFSNKDALFAGIHAGDNNVAHGNIDSGTFVFDALGERWACDLGMGNYNAAGYFGDKRYDYYRCSPQGQNVIALNPVTTRGQNLSAVTTTERFETEENGGLAVVDMTEAYQDKVTSAKRGMKIDHNRTQMLLKDELNISEESDLYWFMHTKADITIMENGKTAVLSKNGKNVYVLLESNQNAQFYTSEAKPVTGSLDLGQEDNSAYRKLNIFIPKANGNVQIAVRFVPIYSNFVLGELNNYRKDMLELMSQWTIEKETEAVSDVEIGSAIIDENNIFVSDFNSYNEIDSTNEPSGWNSGWNTLDQMSFSSENVSDGNNRLKLECKKDGGQGRLVKSGLNLSGSYGFEGKFTFNQTTLDNVNEDNAYIMSIRTQDDLSHQKYLLKVYRGALRVNDNEVENDKLIDIEADKEYTIKVICNFENGTYECYIDGNYIGNYQLGDMFSNDNIVKLVRFTGFLAGSEKDSALTVDDARIFTVKKENDKSNRGEYEEGREIFLTASNAEKVDKIIYYNGDEVIGEFYNSGSGGAKNYILPAGENKIKAVLHYSIGKNAESKTVSIYGLPNPVLKGADGNILYKEGEELTLTAKNIIGGINAQVTYYSGDTVIGISSDSLSDYSVKYRVVSGNNKLKAVVRYNDVSLSGEEIDIAAAGVPVLKGAEAGVYVAGTSIMISIDNIVQGMDAIVTYYDNDTKIITSSDATSNYRAKYVITGGEHKIRAVVKYKEFELSTEESTVWGLNIPKLCGIEYEEYKEGTEISLSIENVEPNMNAVVVYYDGDAKIATSSDAASNYRAKYVIPSGERRIRAVVQSNNTETSSEEFVIFGITTPVLKGISRDEYATGEQITLSAENITENIGAIVTYYSGNTKIGSSSDANLNYSVKYTVLEGKNELKATVRYKTDKEYSTDVIGINGIKHSDSLEVADINIDDTIQVTVHSPYAVDLNVYAASYDKNGTLISVSMDNLVFETKSDKTTKELNFSKGNKTKVFVWEKNTMRPIEFADGVNNVF